MTATLQTTRLHWLLYAALCLGLGTPLSGEERWNVVTAGPMGAAGDQQLSATLALPDGTLLVGGLMGGQITLPALTTASHGGGRDWGYLIRYDPDLGVVINAASFPAGINDLALANDGDVLVLTGSASFKVSPDLMDLRWQGAGGRRIDQDGQGGAFVLTGKKSVSRIGSDGSTLTSFSIGVGFGTTDIAVDPETQQLFSCGSKSARGGGNPVHIAWLHACDFNGSRTWRGYDFSGPEVNSVSDMADSHPQRLAVANGKLYLTGDTEGGNTVYRHDPRTLGGNPGEGALTGTWYNGNTWKAMSSRRIAFVGEYDLSDGRLIAGTFFYGMTMDTRRNKEISGDVDVHGLAVAPDGRVAVTGVMRARMRWTPDAVHQDYTERTHTGRWNNNVGPDELFLAVFEPGLAKASFVSGFSQNGLYEPRGKGHAVAIGNDRVVVAGHITTPPADTATSEYYYVNNAVQPVAGGGKDGYFAILTHGDPEAQPSMSERCLLVVERLGGEHAEGPWVGKLERGRIGEAISALDAAGATAVVEICTRFGRVELDTVIAERDAVPALSVERIDALIAQWAGHALGDEAQALRTAWDGDADFQAALALAQQLRDIENSVGELGPAPEDGIAACTDLAWYRANRRDLRSLTKAIQTLLEDHPESDEAAAAQAIATDLHLPITRDETRRFTTFQRVAGQYERLRGVRDAKPRYDDSDFYRANQRTLDGIRLQSQELINDNGDDGVAEALRGLAERFAIPLE